MPNTLHLPILGLLLWWSTALSAQDSTSPLDLSKASVYVSPVQRADWQKVTAVLRDEVSRRSTVQLPVRNALESNDAPQIVLITEAEKAKLPDDWLREIRTLSPIGPEGYQLFTIPWARKVVLVANDKRGALYAMGKLLRKLEIHPDRLLLSGHLKLSSTPRYEIRGHQLGYRPKTNAYDAWSADQFDQYIRELAIFGANSIEIMPPRTDDDFTSRHMPIPAIEMIAAQSAACADYDLDVWMWYPNMGTDYEHPDSIAKEIAERHEVFAAVPRLDHLFVPGGDPGDLAPDILFAWLEQVATVLHQYHPEAKIWVSPQVFRPTRLWLGSFYQHINRKYDWLGGVVFGPWVKTPLPEIRHLIDPDIPIRRYPDITHSLSSQYPIPHWDLAYAITLGRECINPRPEDQKRIHNALDEWGNGSLSYSEGTNDDVNKFIWSDQDWDPETPVIETLRDYARFFIGPDYTESVAQGLLSLERNLRGPLLTNEQVEKSLWQWQAMEARAPQAVRSNFRFQMGVIRAYFDAYIQQRLIRETYVENLARQQLGDYGSNGVKEAINRCEETLAEYRKQQGVHPFKEKCEQMADDLYESIGAQLTVEKHGAMGGRGNFIDNIDNPLNDIAYIYSELNKIKALRTTEAQRAAIAALLHRENPGEGGCYDNFGDPASWERVLVRTPLTEDPGNLKTPRVSFGVGLIGEEWVHEITATGFSGQATPLAWANQITTLYDQPLEVLYEDLDPESSYRIRVAYTGRFKSRMKLTADGLPVHDFIQTGTQPLHEFAIPAEAVQDGQVLFTWTCGEAERGAQVSEVWIIKAQKE
ncbi:hypothetical protein [Flavilitoribacter nigricans]|uniref:Alpha glucuronidase N-terminal domain-containing protein n=1 Tax=Flavilitoribacter nigricans (strain ATCC 23147 / DSM 23189 / NBRC 102662 / NCIMB 1420 / SS-2) TaxID=1122177 RepID=A0A2D0NA63_FLAN2|nr:hypothetical protein [Flavilitoribacter nigricans]PHN05412.1 hypothetical protein CRP01_15555 [Flavilitoribacter nigricans DSM 23189 = NBRC 102662]